MRRSIVFFNDSFPPVIDGVANVVLNYAKTLGEMGWECTVVAPDAPGTPRGEEVEVLRYKSLPLLGRYPYRVGLPSVDIGFRRKLNKVKADIVHLHCPFTSGWLGLDFSRERKIPVVGTFHSQYAYDFKNAVQLDVLVNIFLSAVVRFYNKMDYVWVPNEFAGEALKSYGYTGKYLCMPNGTDLISDSDLAGLKEEGCHVLDAKPDEFILMFVGRLVKEKNLLFLCDVMKELIKQGTSCRLIFIGEGYYTKELTEYTRKHNLDKCIHFMGPVYDREKLKYAIARADLFVFPSLYDIASLALLDATSLSVPLMMVYGNAIADRIQNEVNGFLCPNDPAEWASRITKLMNEKELLAKVGNKGRNDLVISWTEIIKNVEAHYTEYISHTKVKKKSELV
jgi:glycosyltransferase involved in cell wall biosynthesis